MICTVGHGARSPAELVSILQEAQICAVYLASDEALVIDAGLTLTTR